MTSEATNLQPDSDAGAESIRLDQFLKFVGLAETGGHAKLLIQDGQVEVNGEVETRRRRKVSPCDIVSAGGNDLRVSEYLGQ